MEQMNNLVSKELENFATDFSEKYGEFPVGDYYSDKKAYYIRYLDNITIHKAVRKNMRDNTIEVDVAIKSNALFNPDFIYYLIIFHALLDSADYIKADTAAIQHYLTTTRSRKAIMVGYLELFRDKFTPLNKDRLERIHKLLME